MLDDDTLRARGGRVPTNVCGGARPDDLRRVLRWEDRAAVVEHIALRLRAWVTGVYEHRT